MVEGLIAGSTPEQLSALGRGKLKSTGEVLEAAMDGDRSPRHRLVLTIILNHLRYLQQELARLDRYLIAAMKPYAWAWRLPQTTPGIDEIAAAMILIEIGDNVHRFGSPSRLASWAALCPGNNESAGKRKSGKTRNGNPIVRYLLCEAANAARRTKTVFRAKYDSLVIRRGHKKTIIALAHKLIRTIYFVLARRKPYRDSTFDYEAASVAKNAPRWIRARKKYGYWPCRNLVHPISRRVYSHLLPRTRIGIRGRSSPAERRQGTSRGSMQQSSSCNGREVSTRVPRPAAPSSFTVTLIAHAKDSVWCVDLFRVESILMRSHWVMLVMDVFTRRTVGFGIAPASIDGHVGVPHVQLCHCWAIQTEIPQYGSRSTLSLSPLARKPARAGGRGNEIGSVRSAFTSVRRTSNRNYPAGIL